MEIKVRKITDVDLKDAIDVESAATNGRLSYLEDAYTYYKNTKGDLSVATIDGKIVGIGKLTILFDGSAWLECLRVHPDYQKQGVGKAIYKRYMEQINEQYNCKLAGLYTGIKNIGSYTLATNNGFKQDSFYVSYSTEPKIYDHLKEFKIVQNVDINKLNIKHLNINHTFYRVNKANIEGLLTQGYIYQYEDTIIVMGARFQPYKALYIAYISEGSYKNEALEYALTLAKIQGIQKVIYHFNTQMEINEQLLENYGFTKDPGEDLVMSLEK